MELEIKLTALPGEELEPAAVQQAAASSMALALPTETIQLEAHYHDDADGLLRAAQWSLRARRENHRIVATAKGPGVWSKGVQARVEIETALDRLPEAGSPLPPPLVQALANARVPLTSWPDLSFQTQVERVAIQVTLPGETKAELVIDRGEVEAGELTHPICELELELKSGDPMALLDGALALAGEFPVRPGGRSKGARGLQLLGLLAPTSGPDPTDPPALWSRLTDLEEHLREGHDDLLGHYLRVADALTGITGLARLQIADDPIPQLDSPRHATQLWQIFEAVARGTGANDPRRS